MGVSVIVPCLNEEKYIEPCLQSLIRNGEGIQEFEILVIDGGSTDNTKLLVQNLQKVFAFIHWFDNTKKRTPFALNIGILNANFDFVLIAGAHATYPPNYIKQLINHLNSPNIDVVGGAICTKVKNENPKTEAIRFVLSNKFGVGNSNFRIGTSSLQKVDTVPFGIYRKEVFKVSGMYNEKLLRNQDIELSKRILLKGFSIWLDPELKVDYYARETYRHLAKNNFENGFWNLKTIYITNDFRSLSLRHYIPLLFIGSLLFPVILGFIYFPMVFLSLISLISYLGLIGLQVLKMPGKKLIFYTFIAFLVLHFSYGFGSLAGLLSFIKKNG